MDQTLNVHLHIGAVQTLVEWTDQRLVLPLGSEHIGQGPFRQDPPSPLALENAIEAVEDLVMPLLKQLPSVHATRQLHTRDPWARVLVSLLDASPDRECLSTDDVETVFGQLVAVSQGRPVASSGLPAGSAFVAYVLILREFMHHLGFKDIVVAA